MKQIVKMVLSWYLAIDIVILAFIIVRALPINIFAAIVIFEIAISLFNWTFKRVIKIKRKALGVLVTTLYFLLAPIIIGILVSATIISIINADATKLGLIPLFFIYVLSTSFVSVFTLILYKVKVNEKKDIMKLSVYIIAALFGTAYGLFDILHLVSVSEYVQIMFFGIFVSILFSNVIIEW